MTGAGAVLVACLAAAVPVHLPAQEVTGRLLDAATREPIMLANVALLDTAMVVVYQTITTGSGEFFLSAAAPGRYYVTAGRTGYVTRRDGPLELATDQVVTVDFFLRPDDARLDSLAVAAARERTLRYLESAGFYERLSDGRAWILTLQDIEKMALPTVAAMLASAPDARIVERAGTPAIVFRSPGADPCTPRVLVNGEEVRVSSPEGALIDVAVQVRTVAGVEVHTDPASLPASWAGATKACVTILVWTRRNGAH